MLGVFANSIIVVPIDLLVIFAVLYYYKPNHRLTVGIVAVTLGSLGLAIFSLVLLISLLESTSKATSVAVFLVAIEILTLCLGLASLIKRNSKQLITTKT